MGRGRWVKGTASSNAESAAGAMYVILARVGDESATCSADSSELLNIPTGNESRSHGPAVAGPSGPTEGQETRSCWTSSSYSAPYENAGEDPIVPDDSVSNVSGMSSPTVRENNKSQISSRSLSYTAPVKHLHSTRKLPYGRLLTSNWKKLASTLCGRL